MLITLALARMVSSENDIMVGIMYSSFFSDSKHNPCFLLHVLRFFVFFSLTRILRADIK